MPLSPRACARGYHTVAEAKLALLRQHRTWWQGESYHCPLCDLDFFDSRAAADHLVRRQHPVLRFD